MIRVAIIVAYISGHQYIGSEHLLLGLLKEGEGVAAQILESFKADPSEMRKQVCFHVVISPV